METGIELPRTAWWRQARVVGPLLVLIVAAVIFLVARYTTSASERPLPPTPTSTTTEPNQAALSRDARLVAGKFILTAVTRQNPGASWDLVHPTLKTGFTRREWATGVIPIQPFRVPSIDQARFKVTYNDANFLMLEVVLVPKVGKPGIFELGLTRAGAGVKRHWLVDYWMTRERPGRPTLPDR